MSQFAFYDQAPKEEVKSCNLCGGELFRTVAIVDRFGLLATTVECEACKLRFLSPRMTAEAYGQFYAEGHYRRMLEKFLRANVTPDHLESDQRRYARKLSAFLLPSMNGNRGGTLLDLGGATGMVAYTLAQDFGMQATVVESSKEEAERARNRGLEVITGGIEAFPGGCFDLILLCRTVDHLLDIKVTLGRIRGWMAPKGLFFVDFVHKTPPKIDHPFYLQPTTMRRYLELTGFRVIRAVPETDMRHFAILCGLA